jgi:siroheme synthase-like protein
MVVGGGELAALRVRNLLACGAVVTVVAKEASCALRELASDPALSVHEREFHASDLVGQLVVFAASGNADLDTDVARAARRQGVLVNRADVPEDCDFFHTSVHRAGPVTVSVSSSGTSPALARWLRQRLATEVGPEYEALALLLYELRGSLHSEGISTEGLDWDVLLDELIVTLRTNDSEAARAVVTQWLATSR